MNSVIGGEFSLGVSDLITPELKRYDGYLYSSGRSALYHIVKQIISDGYKRIWLPDYLCNSITNTLSRLDIRVMFYKLDSSFLPDFTSFAIGTNDSFLVINYFGLLKTEGIVYTLKQKYAHLQIIVDNVQAYFEMDEGSVADYQFTSFRKMLGVSDGALVISKYKVLESFKHENIFSQYKMAGALLKKLGAVIELNPNIYLQLIDEGERRIDGDIDTTVNSHTLRCLSSIDYNAVKERRKSNAKYVIGELERVGIKPIVNINLELSIPLFVPICLDNRDYIQSKLREQLIFCPQHWPCLNKNLEMACYMSGKELSIVVDQRYTPMDLEPMIEIIKSNL